MVCFVEDYPRNISANFTVGAFKMLLKFVLLSDWQIKSYRISAFVFGLKLFVSADDLIYSTHSAVVQLRQL